MSYTIGIDTGGTFTDAVLVDTANETVICKAKALTTRDDLSKGILNALSALNREYFCKVDTVSLSTTLATNACVEHRGGRVKLIILGGNIPLISKIASEYGLPSVNEMIIKTWGLTQEGKLAEHDGISYEAEISSLIEEAYTYKEDVDAFAIAAQWGMKNPEFEADIAKKIEAKTGKRVVYASDLSNMLNLMKRAATAYINAGLIPIADEFLAAVKQGLSALNINAHIIIVRGDGGLMSEKYAALHPVETLFSGPAASLSGGTALSGSDFCITVDMGGTTTDMAITQNGKVSICKEGLALGGYRTCTEAIDSKTVALGGDSHIYCDKTGKITVGDARVLPLSYIAKLYPEAFLRMKAAVDTYDISCKSPCQLFCVQKPDFNTFENKNEKYIFEVIRTSPMLIGDIAAKLELTIFETERIAKRLLSLGIIIRSALTPTDLLHCMDIYTPWSKDGAFCGIKELMNMFETNAEEILQKAFVSVCEKLYRAVASTLLSEAFSKNGVEMSDNVIKTILNASLYENNTLNLKLFSSLKLIALGAPAYVFAPYAAKRLGCECVCPENAEVACAYGAACGNITAKAVATVVPVTSGQDDGFRCFSNDAPSVFVELEEALAYAKEAAKKSALNALSDMGGSVEKARVFYETEDLSPLIKLGEGQKLVKLFLETKITATAISR